MTSRQRILIVDDNEVNLAILREVLAEDYELASATSGEECLEKAEEFLPELILLDIMMPGIDGYETCRRLRANPRLCHAKVLMVSARAMVSERLEGYNVGADDYITKPFNDDELLSKVRVYLRLKSVEEINAATLELNAALEAEILRRREAEERLRHDALHDVLTNLPNRALLMDRIERCIQRSRREPNFKFAVLFMDLDDFKLVNDSMGHSVGDRYLVEIAQRLSSCIRSIDCTTRLADGTSARVGGDEFAVLIEGLREDADAGVVSERIRSVVGDPMHIDGSELRPSTSIGIVHGGPDCDGADELLRDADTALYHAKRQGKNQVAFFDAPMRKRVVTRLKLETELAQALERDQLFLHYQPIVDLQSGIIGGFEALSRWNHPVHGSIPPVEFIPVAEETGLIVPLGNEVLRKACAQAAEWKQRFPQQTLSISVNLSGKQLAEPDIVEQILSILDETGLDPSLLNIELTETVLVANATSEQGALERLTEEGLQLYMDDFGTGYSSLSYLARLPLSVLKLDRSFVRDMVDGDSGMATVRAVLEMAHSRGLRVVAEGIETADQAAKLRALGCDRGQGYLFSRPIPAHLVERLLTTGTFSKAVA